MKSAFLVRVGNTFCLTHRLTAVICLTYTSTTATVWSLILSCLAILVLTSKILSRSWCNTKDLIDSLCVFLSICLFVYYGSPSVTALAATVLPGVRNHTLKNVLCVALPADCRAADVGVRLQGGDGAPAAGHGEAAEGDERSME